MAAPEGTESALRLLAPVALVTFAIALLLVLTTSNVDEGGSSTGSRPEATRTTTERARTTERAARRDRLGQDVYTVKTGDTLAGISEKVGIPVENLLELNPDLDPQALVSGQKIKLRE